ncbi:hypothetical protein HFN20_13945 [Paenibacillus dendritiformis]|uniref:hypothetical protein n=1 Tax=Paenibacillus dendritiformis TaxID=130049 RepID=UPI00143D658B|nr:hypothetical protein [Paenibacillus dendritiformis]NKI22306.1 hypothetical protein [Paenibacillus dendritiformis]NRF99528.1 hypothetical protein [Paenibacillus dendritiformis]
MKAYRQDTPLSALDFSILNHSLIVKEGEKMAAIGFEWTPLYNRQVSYDYQTFENDYKPVISNFVGAFEWVPFYNRQRSYDYQTIENEYKPLDAYFIAGFEWTPSQNSQVAYEPIIRRTFIQHDNKYKTYNNGWKAISTTLPSKDTFMNDGLSDLSVLDRKEKTISLPMVSSALGEGRVFKARVDYKKYFDINSMDVK